MFGIMNSVIRVATRSDRTAEIPRNTRWPHREAIERSQSLRAEACKAPADCPANP